MSCYMKIGHYTEADLGFPCDPAVSDAMNLFRLDPKVKTVTFTHEGAGINPAIYAKMVELGATEWICNYSNRVRPTTELTVHYR